MFVGSMAMSFIVEPLALIYVSICMYQCSLSVSLVSLPLTIVLWSVLPDLLTVAIFEAIQKFSSVDCAVSESNWTVCLSIVVVYHFVSDSIIIWTSTLVIVLDIVILWHQRWMNVIHHLCIILALAHFLLLLWVIILVIAIEILVASLVWIIVLILIEVLLLTIVLVLVLSLNSKLVLLVKLLSFCHLVLTNYVRCLIFVLSRLTSHTKSCTVSHFYVNKFSIIRIIKMYIKISKN